MAPGSPRPQSCTAPRTTTATTMAPTKTRQKEATVAECKKLRDEALTPAPSSGFIVSITDKGRMRRLHFLGACGRRPGEHYAKWKHYGELPPRADEIDARCSICFPQSAAAASTAKLPEDINTEDESDTSTSSSSSTPPRAGPAPKRLREA